MQGIVGSIGYGCGNAVVKRDRNITPPKYTISDPDAEQRRFREAQKTCDLRMTALIEKLDDGNDQALDIFNALQSIINDDAFFGMALSRLKPEMINIEHLIYDECNKIVAQFDATDDTYLKERAVDIENVCNDIIRTLMGLGQDFTEVDHEGDIIIVADDLSPADTLNMKKSAIRGFITEKGGATSHTVILAKALSIPAIVGVKGAVSLISDGDFILMDAFNGTIKVNPGISEIQQFETISKIYGEKQQQYLEDANKNAITKDGFSIDVNINTGDLDGIKNFNADLCDGVGLLRTEFLYLSRKSYPDEELQYKVYKELAVKAKGKEVIVRTLDIGGDKQIDYMDLPKEENPFLGFRAIRICLERRDVFKTQLRAILRASAHGNVKIMFPMIVNLEELRLAKICVEEAKQSLRKEQKKFNENIPVGIMIETPAAALMSDVLAEESDFFSIGSNDLIQYITASDRMNERVHYLYDSCNLSVLRAIRTVALNAEASGIQWGICGEVASEESLIPLWVAFGVSELSVAPFLVGRIKHIIRSLNKAELQKKVENILKGKLAEEIRQGLTELLEGNFN
ncbi:MAG: phosphoenolpyruvate--protein phosphotransferase [Treponema sp.]|nr:phosphoenolpyruvate--protein phosphotransferase [Treponema sp.]